MNVQPVTTQSELDEIARWHERRGLPYGWPRDWLSDTGFWVPGVAAGWLITTNSKRALIEDFIANPDADMHERYGGIAAVEAHIVEHAKSLGFRYLIGTTSLLVMQGYARSHGYHVTPGFSYLFKEISQ